MVLQPGEQVDAGNSTKGNLVWGADGPGPRGNLEAAPGVAARQVSYAISDCPVENGVVFTRWGSVQLGTVLAGIAAGFETQVVPIRSVRAGSRAISGLSDSLEIDNRFAATLAGDLAEVALWLGPKQKVKVGSSGNWNSTQAQRWYFIQEASELTDAEIRGGLDGLILAHYVQEWNDKAGGQLRLSTILDRYYSLLGVFDEDYRACERQNHYKAVAQADVLNEQTVSFASALYDATPSLATINSDGLSDYASDAVDALDKTVRASSQMETNCQSTLRASEGTLVEPKLNVIFVVDCRWNYEDITPALSSLAEGIKLHPLGSKITVIGALNHELLFNTSDRPHVFEMNMRDNITIYRQCSQGMRLHDLLDIHLRDHFTEQLEEEKENNVAEVHSNVVVIMPDTSYDIPSAEITGIEDRMDEYTENFPDVKFVIFASQMKESFKLLVEDYSKDVILFQYSSANPIDTWELTERLTAVPRRIANPICGADWEEADYGKIQIYETIPNRHIAYYRIHPKNLFGVGSETIKIRENNKGTVTVCHSRNNEHPQEDDDSDEENDDSECSSLNNGELEIELNNPCGGSGSFSTCNPFFISIEVTESDIKCNDNYCKDVDDVAIEITHSKLTCGAAALKSPVTFVAAAILIISKILFSG